MLNKIFKLIAFFLVFTTYFLLTNFVCADVYTRFITSGTFASQTNEDTLFMCDGSSLSTYNNATYDYFTVDDTNLPLTDDVESIDYCIQGLGDINIGYNTEHFATFIGDGSEQCYSNPSASENIWLHNGYGLYGGALNTNSSTDCLYVKINTFVPTPTNTPTPTLTPTSRPTPTNVPTSIPTSTPIPTNTPTLVKTTSVSDSKNKGNENSNSSNSSAPVCNDQKPGSAPVLLLATSASPNSITLNWVKAKDPVSYYLVTFGTKPGEQSYGNSNIGGSETTSYTINNLSGGENYYFKVRAGNGCMPGDYSNEIIGRLIGAPVTGIPENFTPGVLGTAIGPSTQPLPSEKPRSNNNIKDAKSKNFILYIFLIVVLTVPILLFLYKKNHIR